MPRIKAETIPGIQEQIAAALIAEIGAGMSAVPSAEHLSSRAGLCNGNNQSAGNHKSGQTAKGHRRLRRSPLSSGLGGQSYPADASVSPRLEGLGYPVQIPTSVNAA